jgi:ribosome-binding protein aMBF1 (putative translation factor)
MAMHPTQDWETVVLTKAIKIEQKGPAEVKPKAPEVFREDIKALPKVDVSLQQAIQQARLTKKMSQKDLAQRLNQPLALIQQYENGTVTLPNNQFIANLEKVLQTKLPRVQKPKKTDA